MTKKMGNREYVLRKSSVGKKDSSQKFRFGTNDTKN